MRKNRISRFIGQIRRSFHSRHRERESVSVDDWLRKTEEEVDRNVDEDLEAININTNENEAASEEYERVEFSPRSYLPRWVDELDEELREQLIGVRNEKMPGALEEELYLIEESGRVIIDKSEAETEAELTHYLSPSRMLWRPPMVPLVVRDVILPPGAKYRYFLWFTNDIVEWLKMFYPNEYLISVIEENAIIGVQLYSCFINPKTSFDWCELNSISEGAALRVRMTLGKIHNMLYGYE